MKILSIPIFPLNGVILFPNSVLPLNIFEKRYIEMVDYALTQNRYIGMIQTKNNNELYEIGCIGKINSFTETNDGRYLINLTGKNYFKIIQEISSKKKFKIFKVSLQKIEKNNDFIKNINKERLLKQFSNYIKKMNLEIDLNLINQVKYDELIKFIAMSCPFSTADKQMLLETFDLEKLSTKLIDLLNFYTYGETNNQIN